MSEETEQITLFRGENGFLSNMHPGKVTIENVEYDSVEHAYQAYKTFDEEIREQIRQNPDPKNAKKVGNWLKKNGLVRKDWDEVKRPLMLELVYKKFKHNEGLKKKLIDTYPKVLIEGNWWHDTFWGVCNGVGENWLGIILMRVRDKLMEEEEELFNRRLKEREITLSRDSNGVVQIQCSEETRKKFPVFIMGIEEGYFNEFIK